MNTGFPQPSSVVLFPRAISGGRAESLPGPDQVPGAGAQRAQKPTEKGVSAKKAEYLLVVYPDSDLRDQLLEEQQRFLREYGLPVTVRNKPHITVAGFQAGEAMEETLIRWIQRICGQYDSFEVALNNFGGFPPHTIYLRVQDPLPFRRLAEQLGIIDDFIRSSGWPPAELVYKPYLSIAGSLTEQVYSKAMPDYSGKDFHASFRVGELVLLKRAHAFDACKTVNVFHFVPEGHHSRLARD